MTPSEPERIPENSASSAEEGIPTYRQIGEELGACCRRVVESASAYYHSPSTESYDTLEASIVDETWQLPEYLSFIYDRELNRNREYIAVITQLLKSEEERRLHDSEVLMPGIRFENIQYDEKEIIEAIYDDLADTLEEGSFSSWDNCKELLERHLECYMDCVTKYALANTIVDEIINTDEAKDRREKYTRIAIRIGAIAYVVTTGLPVMAVKSIARQLRHRS